jgi:large subunit ribosomal protein L35
MFLVPVEPAGRRQGADSAEESGPWLCFALASAITPPFRRPAERAAVAMVKCSISTLKRAKSGQPGSAPVAVAAKESQMPKLKTKSGAKKRFKITGTGKVLYAHRGKRHGMIKRTKKQIRQLRGTAVLFKTDGDNIKKYFLPNG